jgi:uncharacterized protein YaiL (DUF2058 family)
VKRKHKKRGVDVNSAKTYIERNKSKKLKRKKPSDPFETITT